MANKWLDDANSLKESRMNSSLRGNSRPEKMSSYVKPALPTPKVGTINRTSGGKTIFPTEETKLPVFKSSIPSAKLSLNSNQITPTKFELPSLKKAVVPDAKLSFGNVPKPTKQVSATTAASYVLNPGDIPGATTYVLVPGDKNGKKMTRDEAMLDAIQQDKYLGEFKSAEEANNYAGTLKVPQGAESAKSLKAQIPDAKLSLGSVDDKFEGNTKMDKLNIALNKMVAPIASTTLGKIATRGQDTVYNIWDKQSGVDKLGKTGRGDGKAGQITDTGSAIGNVAGDIIGFGSSMITNTGGGTMQGALNPIGKLAESSTAKGLAKLSPSLPSSVNKVANYVLPTIAREGVEGAVFGGTLGVDDGVEGVAREAVKGGIENAVFGMGLKGAGDMFSHTLGKLGKVKVKADDGINVSYTKENGSEGTMKKAIFDKESTPLTVNEGVSTLNQSKVADMPTFKGDFDNKVTNELPTVSKVATQVEQPKTELPTPKTNENQFLEPLGNNQASTLQNVDNGITRAVDGEKQATDGINLQTFAGEGENMPISDNIKVPLRFDLPIKGEKATSKFYSNSLKKNNFTPNEVKDMLEESKFQYGRQTNEGQLERAASVIKNNGINEEIERLIKLPSLEDAVDTMEHMLISKELMEEAISTGDFSKYKRFLKYTQLKVTPTAQAMQALSAWKKLTPEGMLMKATKEVEDVVKEIKESNPNLIRKVNKEVKDVTEKANAEGKLQKDIDKQIEKIYKKHGIPTLSNEDLKFITETMQKAEKLEGYDKDFEIAKVVQMIADKIPANRADKIRGLQRIAMLLNPKTLLTRNIGGNTLMAGMENIKDIPGTAMDKLISKRVLAKTGERTRTTGLPSIGTQLKAGKMANTRMNKETKLGINVRASKGVTGKYDIRSGKTWQDVEVQDGFKKLPSLIHKGTNKTLNYLDTKVKNGLRRGDDPFYEAAYQDSLRQQIKLNKVDKPTEKMIAVAEQVAHDRTFQNDSIIAASFDGMRKALNGEFRLKMSNGKPEITEGKGNFGIGNIILPFTRTPANIIDKAIDYSPIGLAKAVGKYVKAERKGFETFDQKGFVDSFGRGVTGSAAIALGIALAKNGVITGADSKDADQRELNKLMGQTAYSFVGKNGSYSFDWAQPVSVPLAIGADIYNGSKNKEGVWNTIVASAESGANTIFDQSLFQSITKIFSNYDGLAAGITDTLTESPVQFFPTLGKQIAQAFDDTTRSSYDPAGGKVVLNKMGAKLPGVSSTLEPRINTVGEEVKTYGDSKGLARMANIFLNPGFYTEKTDNKGLELVKKIYDETGLTIQFPRVAAKSFTDGDKNKVSLTAKEYTQYQTLFGQKTNAYLQTLSDPGTAGYEELAEDIQDEMTAINKEVKNQILSQRNLPMLKETGSKKSTETKNGDVLSTSADKKKTKDTSTTRSNGTVLSTN